jgi:acetolactate synthase-1/2/3 large subunit
MNIADCIAGFLASRGVPCVFELSGGMITLLLDALYRDGRIGIVSVHHEQAAAFAAEAMGRITGLPGVAMATSGPGATNLLTGIGSCYFDSSPAVFITGQVNRHEQRGERAIRQLGFQETDIVAMAAPITKAAWKVSEPSEVLPLLAKAFALALEGRPGPVLVDIPMDIQKAHFEEPVSTSHPLVAEPSAISYSSFLDDLASALRIAQRPLLLAGGGVRSGRAVNALRSLSGVCPVPVVHSLMGVDVLPFEHPQRVGMIGSYGNRWANIALAEADMLLVLGSRLDVRQTGADTDSFRGERPIFHVDVEAGEINNRVQGCTALVSALKPFLLAAVDHFSNESLPDLTSWRRRLRELREKWPDTAEQPAIEGINPNVFIHELSRAARDAAAYVVDVGQHQMWAAQSLELTPDQRFLTSGGMGSMGFSLPAAVGAAFATTPKPIVLIAGDGGFQCNIQELQTVARNRLPLRLVVLNNQCHGMVRQFQESYFEGRYQSTMWGYSAPDFAAVSAAYAIPARTISQPEEISCALQWLNQGDSRPRLLHVMIDPMANAYPKIAFGKPISEMEPLAKPLDMEAT